MNSIPTRLYNIRPACSIIESVIITLFDQAACPGRDAGRGRKIRYVENSFDQFVDSRKKLSSSEKYELIRDFRVRSMEMLAGALEQRKEDGGRNMPYETYGRSYSVFSSKKKYTEEVNANAIAYVRTVRTSGRGRMMTSPLFEYTYEGQKYLAIYDQPIEGCNADIDLGPVTIKIDPDDPESVYNNSSKHVGLAILTAVLCVALVSGLIFAIVSVMLNNDTGEDPYNGSLYQTSEEMITDEMVDKHIGSMAGYKDKQWYCETVPILNIETYDNGDYWINLADPLFPSIGSEKDVSYWHDELIVFYVVEENEGADGKAVISKSPLLYFNADEHTYTGSHGGYEG